MPKNTSVSLGDYFDEFIATQIELGYYKNASEVVREALRLLAEKKKYSGVGDWDKDSLMAAIKEGEESGIAEGFEFEKFIEERKNGKKLLSAKKSGKRPSKRLALHRK